MRLHVAAGWAGLIVGLAAPGAAFAQAERPGIELLREFRTEQIAAVLIFGTGFVAAVLWGLSAVVRAFRQDSAAVAEVRSEVARLEQRVLLLEQALGTPAESGGGAGVHR